MSATTKRLTEVVILGGGYAGLLAAYRLAGKDKQKQLQITLVNGADHFVERIRLHQLAAGQRPKQRPFANLLAGTGIHFVHGWVTGLTPHTNQVTVQTAAGETTLSYDYLFYALGSTIDTGRIPGIAEHAYTLADEQSSQRLQQRLAELNGRGRVLVIGGGLTGIELATEIAESHPQLDLTLATSGEFGADLSAKGAQSLREVLVKLNITLKENHRIARIRKEEAETAAGQILPFDLCLWAGAFTVPKLAQEAGLLVNKQGQVLVDGYLRSLNYANIYALGDAAATGLRMACATAMPQGAYAASHLLARLGREHISPFRFSYTLRCISLGRKRGLVQMVKADDTPKERVIGGWWAARIKELICRYTIMGLKLEKLFPGSYRWPQSQLPLIETETQIGAESAVGMGD